MALARIKKGDDVIIRSGKYKGQAGVVEKVLDRGTKIVVKGINVAKRHVGKKITGGEGAVLEIAKPLNASVVQLATSEGEKVKTRVEMKDGKKIRVNKATGKEI